MKKETKRDIEKKFLRFLGSDADSIHALNDTVCWEWQGNIFEGTPRIQCGQLKKVGQMSARKVALWLWSSQGVPKNARVTTTCENSKCVNPRHAKITKPMKFFGLEAIESKIEKTEDCWIWRGKYSTQGHPIIINKGTSLYVRRELYATTHKQRARRDQVTVMTCENPECVNPDHIKLVAHKTMVRTKNSKLTPFQIDLIKKYLSSGAKQTAIAKRFKISESLVSRIKKGERWG